jgi:CDP-glucose 4,6-dehydratase
MFQGFYDGKKVFVTGHTGFKGAWLTLWLKELGAEVHGYSWPAPTTPSLHELLAGKACARETIDDIRNLAALKQAVQTCQPDILFHLAAQPIVRRSYADPMETFTINGTGTANVLEAVRQLELSCAIVAVTSDKCYENQGWDFGYRESDPMGGHDVYSMSKGVSELVVQSWRRSFFEVNPKLGQVATARAGNVIGGGDYAEDRLVPDCIRSLMHAQPVGIRNPAATRPWQHVLDCLSGYLWLGARLGAAAKPSPLAGAFNFGPGLQANVPVSKVVEEALKWWPGTWQNTSETAAPKEAKLLNLSIDKAARQLGWFPTWELEQAVEYTVRWYHERHVAKNSDMAGYSHAQIRQFCQAAQSKRQAWAVS